MRPERVRIQLTAQKGGADVIFDSKGQRVGGARMMVVVTLRPGEKGRRYRLPTEADYAAVALAQERVAQMVEVWERGGRQGLCPVPDETLPPIGTLGFRVQRYGIFQWGDLFTARQKAALVELAVQIQRSDHSTFLRELLACALSVFVRACNGNARLRPDSSVAPAFGMQTLPITWTFPETVISGDRSENFDGALSSVAQIVLNFPPISIGQMQQADATDSPLPHQSASVWFTDPPYYNAIPYADLSDFFLVWLKRTLPDHHLLRDPNDVSNPLSPKAREVVQDETRHDDGRRKDSAWFEERVAEAFAEGRRVLGDEGIGSVVFAHKTTEGWEALLSGMIRGGWTITGSWPIATESPSRLRARESAALATSIHLVGRPRLEDAPIGDWADVLRELPERVGDWMQRLQGEGVRGADLVFACVGPALEVYSRYARVETAEGRGVELPEYLEKVWEVVGREALEQVLGTAEAQARNGVAGALEEDARLTSLFLWTMQSTAGDSSSDSGSEAEKVHDDENRPSPRRASSYSLPFDVARRFAQPLGIHLDDWESRIIKTEKGVVRLLPVTERGTQLFGEAGADALADAFESNAAASPQLSLFPEEPPSVRGRARRGRAATSADELEARHGATTLDRIHAAMLLQASGRSQALRNLLRAEQERGPDFLRLANALTALYPPGSEEKRLLDAMLLAAPR